MPSSRKSRTRATSAPQQKMRKRAQSAASPDTSVRGGRSRSRKPAHNKSVFIVDPKRSDNGGSRAKSDEQKQNAPRDASTPEGRSKSVSGAPASTHLAQRLLPENFPPGSYEHLVGKHHVLVLERQAAWLSHLAIGDQIVTAYRRIVEQGGRVCPNAAAQLFWCHHPTCAEAFTSAAECETHLGERHAKWLDDTSSQITAAAPASVARKKELAAIRAHLANLTAADKFCFATEKAATRRTLQTAEPPRRPYIWHGVVPPPDEPPYPDTAAGMMPLPPAPPLGQPSAPPLPTTWGAFGTAYGASSSTETAALRRQVEQLQAAHAEILTRFANEQAASRQREAQAEEDAQRQRAVFEQYMQQQAAAAQQQVAEGKQRELRLEQLTQQVQQLLQRPEQQNQQRQTSQRQAECMGADAVLRLFSQGAPPPATLSAAPQQPLSQPPPQPQPTAPLA